MDSVNLQTAVENFKKRLACLYKLVDPELEKKYIDIFKNVYKAYNLPDEDIALRSAKISCLGFVFGHGSSRLVVNATDRVYNKSRLCKLVPENDDFNLLSIIRRIPKEVPVTDVDLGSVHKLAVVSVYSRGLYDEKWGISRPSLSCREILSQIPENLMSEVSAFAILDDSPDCFENYNVLLGLYSFKIVLYGGDVVEK